MSTRLGGVSGETLGMNTSYSVGDTEQNVTENRWRFCEGLDIWQNRLALQNQVHGDNIAIVDRPCTVENNDALITRTKNIYVSVSIADCQPVFLYDSRNAIVAAVHAGWRGSAKHIVAKALHKMAETFGTKSQDVLAFVGPAASQCCYEVDAAVASQFDVSLSIKKENNKFMLDLKGATLRDMLSFGVVRTHIEISPMCTICDKEFFHSYRRDGARSGRMLGVIGIRNDMHIGIFDELQGVNT